MSGYIGVQPVPQATQRREYFTATSGQTTFNTNGYTPGYIDVFMNGVKLSPSDFTATNGSDVVLASGAATGDLLQVISFTPFNVANQTFVGNVNLSSGAYQIGGTTILDSSKNADLRTLKIGSGTYNTNTNNYELKFGWWTNANADIDGLIPGTVGGSLITGPENSHIVVGLRDNDVEDSFAIVSGGGGVTDSYMDDSTWDKVVFRAKADGQTIFGGNVNIASGDLQMGGTSVIDSSRNILAPNVTISSSNSNEFTFTRSATSKTTLGFGTSNQSIASTGPLSIKPDGTTVNKYTFGSNDFVINGPNVAINNGSPELHFGTTSATHYNWRLAAQETLDAAFEIAVGSQDADYSDDTYSALVTVKNTGDVNITTGGLNVSSGTTTYRNQINNASTAFSATGTLYVNTALNGSGEGVLISSQTRTTNDNDVSMFRAVSRAGDDAFRINVDGTTTLPLGATVTMNTGAGTRKLYMNRSDGVRMQREGDSYGFAAEYGFNLNDGTNLGGFGAHHTGTALSKFYIGTDYNNPILTLTSGGNLTTTGNMLADYYFLGVNNAWKIRPNNGNAEFCLEYDSTTSALSDANIKFKVASDGRVDTDGTLRADGSDKSVTDRGGNINFGTVLTNSGFAHTYGDLTNANNSATGWVTLGSTHGSSPYPKAYYKIIDYSAFGGSSDAQWMIFHDGDSNYADGATGIIRAEGWYNANPNRLSGLSYTCLSGYPMSIWFIIDRTNNAVWVTTNRIWGNLYIKRIGGQYGGLSTSQCAWENGGPLSTNLSDPSSSMTSYAKVRGGMFTYNVESGSFQGSAGTYNGETW